MYHMGRVENRMTHVKTKYQRIKGGPLDFKVESICFILIKIGWNFHGLKPLLDIHEIAKNHNEEKIQRASKIAKPPTLLELLESLIPTGIENISKFSPLLLQRTPPIPLYEDTIGRATPWIQPFLLMYNNTS